jgi:hypothetical protein
MATKKNTNKKKMRIVSVLGKKKTTNIYTGFFKNGKNER